MPSRVRKGAARRAYRTDDSLHVETINPEKAARLAANNPDKWFQWLPETPASRAAWLAEMNARSESLIAQEIPDAIRPTGRRPHDPLDSIRTEWPYVTGDIYTKGYDY